MFNDDLIIEYDTSVSFENVKTANYFSSECDINNTDVLLLPYERFREGYEILFSEQAKEILRFLENSNQIKVDVPCSDEDFKEIELHDAVFDLGIFLLTSAVLPVFLNLISSYLYDKIKKRGKDAKAVETKIEINVEKDKNKTIKFKYKGSAKGFVDSLKEIEKITKDD